MTPLNRFTHLTGRIRHGGSPDSRLRGRGRIPYVKVVHIQNWRVIESAKYMISAEDAAKMRRKKALLPFDLITPTRASRNIGLFGVIMPWQTDVILTRENYIWRVSGEAKRIDPWLLLALGSLKVVHDQFKFLVLMQMNREDLGARFRELLLPLPRNHARREQWSAPIREYFQATSLAREKYDLLAHQLDSDLFVDKS
jgi:type I restriction enzyme M protein